MVVPPAETKVEEAEDTHARNPDTYPKSDLLAGAERITAPCQNACGTGEVGWWRRGKIVLKRIFAVHISIRYLTTVPSFRGGIIYDVRCVIGRIESCNLWLALPVFHDSIFIGTKCCVRQ